MYFEKHLKMLSKITGKTPQEILQIINELADSINVRSTKFLKELLIKLDRIYPYAYYKIRQYLAKPILYSEVARLFQMLEELGLIERVEKIKGKGKYGLIVYKLVEGMENHRYWQNPRRNYYKMRRWQYSQR